MLSKSCLVVFLALKHLKIMSNKFHILRISRLLLFTQITLSIIAYALPDIDMSMVLLFLIEEITISDIKLSDRLWKIENAYVQNHFNYIITISFYHSTNH